MRIFLLFLFIFIQSSCTTIEVAKEVSKVSTSIKESVTKISKNVKEKNKKINKENTDTTPSNKKRTQTSEENEISRKIKKDKEEMEREKKEQQKLVSEQKKITQINFLKKTQSEINKILGKESLVRKDSNIIIYRYDSNFCRLFFFFDSDSKKSLVKHYELRDNLGNLIKLKEKIQTCYKKFGLN